MFHSPHANYSLHSAEEAHDMDDVHGGDNNGELLLLMAYAVGQGHVIFYPFLS